MASVIPAAKLRQLESLLFLISNLTLRAATGVLSGNLNVAARLNVEPYEISAKSVEIVPIT